MPGLLSLFQPASTAAAVATFPNFKLEEAFGTADPFSAAPVYTDITSRLLKVNWKCDRQRELDLVTPGTSMVTVDNSDRGYEPGYTGSPYYPNVKDSRRIRLSVQVGTGSYQPVFTHYVDEIHTPWESPNDQIAELSCVDALTCFALCDLTGLFPQQSVSARLNAILDKIGWSAAARNIQAGGTNLPTVTFKTTDNAKALDQMQLAIKSRPGILYIDGSGNVVGYAGNGPSGGLPYVFGGSGVEYSAAGPRLPRALVYNVVKLSCSSPALTSFQQDTASQGDHQHRVFEESVLATTQAGIDSIANTYLANYKFTKLVYDPIGVIPMTDQAFRQVLACTIGATGTLNRSSDVGAAFTDTIVVNSYEHDVDVGERTWHTTLRLAGKTIS